MIEKAGLERFNLHALRHKFATRPLENNQHPKTVQELLGHSSISMTLDIYSHVMPEIKQRQKAVESLDNLFTEKKKEGINE